MYVKCIYAFGSERVKEENVPLFLSFVFVTLTRQDKDIRFFAFEQGTHR